MPNNRCRLISGSGLDEFPDVKQTIMLEAGSTIRFYDGIVNVTPGNPEDNEDVPEIIIYGVVFAEIFHEESCNYLICTIRSSFARE